MCAQVTIRPLTCQADGIRVAQYQKLNQANKARDNSSLVRVYGPLLACGQAAGRISSPASGSASSE